MSYTIKAMSVGEILDQAVQLIKKRFKLLLSITCFVYIPFFLLQNICLYVLVPHAGQNVDPAQIAAAMQQHVPGLILYGAIFGLISLIVIWPLTNAAIIHAIANEYLGRPITAGEAIRYGLSVMLRLLGTTILAGLLTVLGLCLCFIPGIYLALRYWLVTYVVVIEGLSGSAALKRSMALTKGNVGTAFVLGFLIMVIAAILGKVGNIIPFYPAQLIIAVAVQALVVIFGAAASVVYYFSCRSKLENFDLQVLAEAVAVE